MLEDTEMLDGMTEEGITEKVEGADFREMKTCTLRTLVVRACQAGERPEQDPDIDYWSAPRGAESPL